ncbi:MAG: riboflavin synthase [Desulfovibrio sp.]|jgi:riboflavin synthase|nr:riboflavin synthase [Desulfovibrio sp.]
MFTGLVAGLGETLAVDAKDSEARFSFRVLFPVKDWKKGESIAINGVCLSVESFGKDSFCAYASRETMRLTNLSALRRGDRVNLERALSLGERLGGHLVSGHADGMAWIESIKKIGDSRVMRFTFPEEFSSQVVAKGSVALDGVSLTVNHCGIGFLEVNIIPETLQNTTIGSWKKGYRPNFETDLIGKYVANMLQPLTEKKSTRGLDLTFLRENGF